MAKITFGGRPAIKPDSAKSQMNAVMIRLQKNQAAIAAINRIALAMSILGFISRAGHTGGDDWEIGAAGTKRGLTPHFVLPLIGIKWGVLQRFKHKTY
jgi:hypothetical protein